MQQPSETVLFIGELAAKAGISVRALRHYEAKGLIHPMRDPQNDRRRYTQSEISTVLKIVALKSVGLSLAQIGQLLRGGLAVAAAVQMQIETLQKQQAETVTALQVLQSAAQRLKNGTVLDVELLCNMLRSIQMTKHPMNDVIKDYFDDEQMQQIKNRGTTPNQLVGYQEQWSGLIAKVQTLIDDDVPANNAMALDCAKQWNGLVSAFTQNDPGITQSLRKMYADKEKWSGQANMPYSPEVGNYIMAAQTALSAQAEK